MKKKNNRTCVICGKNYSYCPNCGEDAEKPTWYFIFCSENCKDIYDVCVQYRDKELALLDAQKEIKKLDISNIDNFAKSTKAQIQEILEYKEENRETVKKISSVNTTEDSKSEKKKK